MNLSEGFIKRPVMTTLVMAAIAFFGILAYKALPISDLPEVEFPTIEVTVTYPGADPVTVSNNVVTPLEQQFTTMEGIHMISSTSSTGKATILLQFTLDRNIDLAAPDVLAAINAAQPQLPKDLPYAPTYKKANPTSTPILFFTVTSDTLTAGELYDYGHNILGERLYMVEGVSLVQSYGSPYAVRIQVDPQKLAARNIGINEFGNAIREANVYLPTGTFYGPTTEYTINCHAQMEKAEPYNHLIIKNDKGLITRVSDVGKAFDGLWNDKYYLHYINKEVDQVMVGLAIQKEPGANTLETIQRINDLLPELEAELPGSLKIWRMYDQSGYIKDSIFDVETTLLIALALVVFVIFIYLGRLVNTAIPSLAIPMSILGTLIVMKLLGYTIDILSLLAITLSIGFLVDDAIVVLENIARHVEQGDSRLDGALKGSKQISFTILSMTTCLCVVFIPLIFMEGIIGRILHEFAMTIVIAVAISGMISLSFTPMLCSRFIASYKGDEHKTKVEKFSERFNQALLNVYRPALHWAIKHKKTVLTLAFASLAGTLALVITLPKDFLPDDDIGFIQGYSQGPDGTSPFETGKYLRELEKITMKNSFVTQMVSIGAVAQDNQGLFFIHLDNDHKRPSTQKVIDQLYAAYREVPGIQIFLKPLPLINLQVGANAAKANYQYTLQSMNPDDLYPSAEKLLSRLQTLPELKDVTSDMDINQPQLNIEIDRDKASLYGITARNIENALSLAYADINLSPINMPDDQYYVIMEVLPKFYRDPSMLSQIWLASDRGKLVPFSEVVNTNETIGPLTVNHLNTLPSATLTFNLADKVALGTALEAIDKATEDLPRSVFGHVVGAAQIFKKSFANLNFLLLITIFIIYIILGILYENFFHPVTVMSTLPPAALGGLLSLVIFGYSLSLYAFVGLIMLLGIVMKNGIILVDFANESVEKNKTPAEEAIVHAALTRFRPILMTTFAALMGSVPIAIGIGGITAQSRRPLGVVIVFGLLFSQILTLFLTPVIYLYIEKIKAKLTKPKESEG